MTEYVHCYRNSRPDVDWNTCGLAAVATMIEFWGLDPWSLSRTRIDPRNGKQYWDDGAAIDAIKGDGFEPDIVFGLGTTGGTVRDALHHYGLSKAAVAWSGIFSAGWEDRWRELQDYIANGYPVPVIVDCGALGGTWYMAHWAIAYHVDECVRLGAMEGIGQTNPTVNEFLKAWHCWFLPAGFNHCGVFVHP